jgi:hypothetical protein
MVSIFDLNKLEARATQLPTLTLRLDLDGSASSVLQWSSLPTPDVNRVEYLQLASTPLFHWPWSDGDVPIVGLGLAWIGDLLTEMMLVFSTNKFHKQWILGPAQEELAIYPGNMRSAE